MTPAVVVGVLDAMARIQDDQMTRMLPMTLAVALLSLTAVIQPPLAAAQQLVFDAFPAAALVRGENVWLRLDPATDTEVLTLLQRGDPITVTGESVFDGDDEYYPIESDLTGESGWIDALFIDPRSIAGTSTVVVPLETVDVPAEDGGAVDDTGNQRQQDREARRQARQANAAQEPAAEPTPETSAEDDRAARRAARQAEQESTATEAEQPANDRAARRAARQTEQEASAAGANAATDSLTFSGTESTATAEFTPPSDMLAVTANYEGNGRFVVVAVSPDGTETALFDERGPFTGDTTFETDPASTLYLDVEANGAWDIAIAPAA